MAQKLSCRDMTPLTIPPLSFRVFGDENFESTRPYLAIPTSTELMGGRCSIITDQLSPSSRLWKIWPDVVPM